MGTGASSASSVTLDNQETQGVEETFSSVRTFSHILRALVTIAQKHNGINHGKAKIVILVKFFLATRDKVVKFRVIRIS